MGDCGGGPHIEVMPGLIFTPARAAAVLLAFCCAQPAHAQFSNNPCDQFQPEDVTCAMGMEELCKGTFSLWAMYAGKLGSPPDDDMTCCTASVFSAECTGVWCVLARCRCAPQVTCVSSCPSTVADPMRSLGLQPGNDAGAEHLSNVPTNETFSSSRHRHQPVDRARSVRCMPV